MRSDYLFYILAVVFFVITATSLIIVNQSQQSLWVVSSVVLGLFSAGLGYYYRPKTKAVAVPIVEVQTADTNTAYVSEPRPAETLETRAEPTVTPLPVVTVPSKLAAPVPVITLPAPKAAAPVKSELTVINGINDKRAAQLRHAGITSLDALANASADDLAEILMVSPRITRMWIGTAKKLKK
jgi:predicted flap endonuclease-1-like 5' DNA nuclease